MQNQFNFEANRFAFANDRSVTDNSRQYIRRLQQALNRALGLQLPLDGVMSFRTRRAIRNFQRQRGLPADGAVTPQTRNALGLSKPILPKDFLPLSSEIFGEREYEDYEAATCQPFTPVAVENPRLRRKDGRINDKKIPDSSDLVTVQGAFAKTRLHRLAAEALKALVCAARADGIKHPRLLPTGGRSGFRDPKFQKEAWERALKRYGSAKIANKWVAKPGFSAHQTGRAIDFYLGLTNDSRNVTKLRQTSAYKWMVGNAHRFGFYPYPDEPWHWEYNPPASVQPEMFSPTNESFDFENDFESDESFEFADETGDLEFETALDVLSPSELKAVKITSTFETGRAGGFGGLTGNFDGQGVSFGLLNFAFKADSLPPLLQEFVNKHPARYSAIFGKDAGRFKDILFATKPDPKNPKRQIRDLARQMEFVNTQMNLIPKEAEGNRIIEPWKSYFGKLENDSEFRKIQVKAVRAALNRARYWFNYFGFKTERGFAFMFDLVSSHGGAWLNAPKFKGRRRALLQKMLADKQAKLSRNALTELEKMEVIANMIADDSSPKWRKNARIRKLWFVRGSGKVHGTFYDIRKNFGVTDNAPDFGYKTPSAASASELARESGYDEREFEQFEQSVSPPAPPLLGKPEKAAHGETFYVKIGLGKGLPASTGIYVPNRFKPDSNIAIVLYLHGHKGGYPGNAVLINGYWNAARFPFFALREEVSASGQNVIFVAPSLGNLSQADGLIQKGGFDRYINRVSAALNEHFMMPRYNRRIQDVKSIILAAHSGGGTPMLRIAKGTDRNAAKITEYWGFDSMYGAVASSWVEWAKSNPNQKLYVYYGSAKGQYDAKTGKNEFFREIMPKR